MPKRRLTRLPSDLPVSRVNKALTRLGFVVAREGSKHTIFIDPENPKRHLSIPRHARVKRELLAAELKGVGVPADEFMAVY